MLFWVLVIIVLSLLSFQGGLYWRLLPRFGIGWSYGIDQGLPLLVAAITAAVVLRRRIRVIALLKEHRIPIVILLLATGIAHGWILRYYFFAEDVSTILFRVNNGELTFPFHPLINGYPFASFVASYMLFQTNAWLYNVVSLLWFTFAVISFYFFVSLFWRSRSLALPAALYFATTPTFLDVFSWQANAQGMPLVLGLHLVSFICVLLYKKSRQTVYFFLSLLFFAAGLKMGFVRIAGLVFPLILLIWVPTKTKQPLWVKIGESMVFGIVWMGFVVTRLVPGGLQAFLRSFTVVHAPSFRWEGYWERLSYYMAHLVLPNTLGETLFPLLKNFIGWLTGGMYMPQSMVWLLGIFAIIFFGTLGAAVLLIPKKTVTSWIILFAVSVIFGSMFYVPLYIATTTNRAIFDQYFIRATPPYGPGARYIFSASPGMSILFALFLVWLQKRKPGRVLAGILLIVTVVGNSLLSAQNHRAIIAGISNPERSLISKFFAMVPRDGKPKLVYSVNPQRNVIDNNVSGWHWLYGFYRRSELTYSNNREEVKTLIKEGGYEKNRLYAFYTNPETFAFVNISDEARKEFFEQTDIPVMQSPLPIPISSATSQSQFQAAGQIEHLFIAKRPVLTSPELLYRILAPSRLHLHLEVAPLSGIPYPFSDTVFPSDIIGIPQQLWGMMRVNAPLVVQSERELESSFSLVSFNDKPLTDISLSDRFGIARVLSEQEQIRRGLRVWVSNIFPDDPRSTRASLVDGVFDADPAPTKDDVYYFARETPATITLQLAYPIILGRVLLNTPKSMVSDHLPTNITVLASLRGGLASVVGTLTQEAQSNWSPNNGVMLIIPTKQILADSISIVVSKTTAKPVILDEIIVDPVQSLAFTPAQILEVGERNFWYVGNETLFQTLLSLKRYQTLTLAYACAEENDWIKQKRKVRTLVPGVWKLMSVPIPVSGGAFDIEVPLDCHGSVLRQVTLVGPMFPARIRAGLTEVR